MAKKKQLGKILMEAGIIDEHKLKSALGYQKKWGGRLGRVLVDNNWISEEALVNAIHNQTGIEIVNLDGVEISKEIIDQIPVELAERHILLPIGLKNEAGRTGESIVLAMADPTDLTAQDEVQFYTGKKVKVLVASESSIAIAIKHFYHGRTLNEVSADFFHANPEGIQFRGHDVDVDDVVIVDGKLESPPGGSLGPETEKEPLEGNSTWTNEKFGDPFEDLDTVAETAELKPVSPDSIKAKEDTSPGEGPVQESPSNSKSEGMVAEDDLPEVEIIEELPWDAATTPGGDALQPRQQISDPAELDSEDPLFEPPVQLDDQVEVDEDDQAVEALREEHGKEMDSMLDHEPPLEEASQPLADSSWLTQPSTKKDFDYFDSIPTNSSAFGVSGDLLGSDSLLGQQPKEPPDVKRIGEREKIDPLFALTDQEQTESELEDSVAIESPFAQTDLNTEEVVLPDTVQKIHMNAISEKKKRLPEPDESVPPSLVVELADEVQKLLDGLESDQVNGEPPTVVKSSQLIAAVIRILLKRDVFSEVELLEELKQR